jgi:UDP-N-acetylglucosamine--dolichyl-phosphate N-acetylglucosaminephosphotransferase
MRDIRPAETLGLSAVSLACIAVLVDTWRSNGEPLYASLAISGLAFAFSYAVILWTGDVFLKRGYKGRDMSKKNPVEM